MLCQSTTTHGLFFKGLDEELELSATFFKVLGALDALPSFFKEGSVSSFNWDSCLLSFCFRAASLAASSAEDSLVLLWDLDLGLLFPLTRSFSRAYSAFFKASMSSASFFEASSSCLSAEVNALFKAPPIL